jgi:hypothetical protein
MKGKIRERLILGNLSTDKLRKKNAIFFPNQALLFIFKDFVLLADDYSKWICSMFVNVA